MLALLRRARAVTVLGAVALVLAVNPAAQADTTADAQRDARDVLARVHDLQAQVRAAEAAYDRSLTGVARAVTLSSLTERARDELAARTAAAQQALDNRIRGLYMTGGTLTVYASLLDSGSISDFQTSSALVGKVMAANDDLVRADNDVVQQVAARVARADRATDREIATARDVAQAADKVQRLLDAQQRLLDEAAARVQHLKELDAARAAAAAQSAAFGTITTSHLTNLHVLPPSDVFLALYHHAAATCPGLSWTVLASIGQVESGHGRNPSTSYAGAMGPMQFLPSTFQAYAADGDHDGRADIMDPADAIFTAARYLCANGAGGGGNSLYRAVWHYNHADWYVQMVLSLAQKYAAAFV